MNKKKNLIRNIILVILAVLIIVPAVYLNDYYRPDENALKVFDTAVKENDYYMFKGTGDKPVNVVFYPGGKVDYRAYSVFANELAQSGFNVYVLKVPFNLSILSNNKADVVFNKINEKFIVMGHSLGGTSASYYTFDKSQNVLGLVLLGSYTVKDLSGIDIPALAFVGTQDKVMNMDNYNKYKNFLPKNTGEISIEGGNHSQYGNYGHQKGDGEASISSDEQQAKIAEEMVRLRETLAQTIQ